MGRALRGSCHGFVTAALALLTALLLITSAGPARATAQGGNAVPSPSTPLSIKYSGSFDMTNTAIPQRTPHSYVYHVEWTYLWSGTWQTLFPDKSRFNSDRTTFPQVTLSGTVKATYREKVDGPNIKCSIRIVADPANRPAFSASYDSSAGTLQVSVEAPTFRGGKYVDLSNPNCVGGPGVNVFSAPRDFNPLGEGATVDLEKGGTHRYDKDWPWTHRFGGGERREFKASIRSELTVGQQSCGAERPAPGECGPSVWSVTFSKTPWSQDVGFTPGAALLVDRRGLGPIAVDGRNAAPGCDQSLAVWMDCGGSNKVWPVAFVRNTAPTIAEVRFKMPSSCPELGVLTLEGRARVPGGGTIGFRKTEIKQRGCGEIVVRGLTGEGRLPNSVQRLDRLAITWTFVERDGTRHPAGTSKHLVYLLFAPPTDSLFDYGPDKKGRQPTLPLLSVVDLGTVTASDAGDGTTEQTVVDRIFEDFQDRIVRPRTLDPNTGRITLDDPLFYYWKNRPWTIEARLVGAYPVPACGTTEALLRVGSSGGGLCDAWAHFFADALALQGIQSLRVSPAQENGWKKLVPKDAEFMLIKSWEFGKPDPRASGSTAYPYFYKVTYRRSGSVEGTGNFAFRRPTPEEFRGQGPQLFPPGMFGVVGGASHALVRYPAAPGGRIYDPSYGKRADTIRQWARGSLDGWARLDGDGGDYGCDKGTTCALLGRKLPPTSD